VSGATVWEDGAWHQLPPLRGNLDADICVIGLGGSGLACVGEALALGQQVVGLDAGSVAEGAAGRNGGFLLAGLPAFYHTAAERFGRDRVHALYRRTMRELDRMADETPDLIWRAGSLRIAIDAVELADCQEQLTMMRADGLPVESYHGIEGDGLLVPTDAAFNPLARCRRLAARALERGAVLHEQSRVVDIAPGQVRTREGAVRCRVVIVAVDGGLERLLPELRGRTRTARLQMLSTEPLPQLIFPRPVYQRWGYEYWQQLADRRIALGGLRDRAGDAEWTDEADVTAALQRDLEAVLRDRLHVTAAVTRRWAGAVGYSHDGWPVIAEVRPGVWAIGGYSGTGNILGALCGRGVVQLAATGATELLAELLP
jgi:glycine/D-amino acid oxidase-like deaminating enzyme